VNRVAAHPKAQNVLDSLEGVFQIGKPESFSSRNGASKSLGKSKEILSFGGYFAPIFLND